MITIRNKPIILILLAIGNFTTCCTAARCKTAKDINPPACNVEDLKDDVLVDICRDVHYDLMLRSLPPRKKLVQAAHMCLFIKVEFNNLDYGIDARKGIKKRIDNSLKLETSALGELLYHEYLDLMETSPLFADGSRQSGIDLLLSKYGIHDMQEMSSLTEILLKKTNEDIIKNYPTAEEIAKLPKWSEDNNYVGIMDRQMKVFRINPDNSQWRAVVSLWSAASQSWSSPTQVENNEEQDSVHGWNLPRLIRRSIQYDHLLTVQWGLPGGGEQTLLAGHNNGDNPLVTARGLIKEYNLDQSILMQLADNIRQILIDGGHLSYPPIPRVSDLVTFILVLLGSLVFVLLVMYGFSFLLVPKRKKRKKAMKLNPKKSPLLCHQPVIKKTIYVKSFAIKRLNRGNRLNGIVTGSFAQDIEIERKIDQPTVMYKIRASNGEIYVPVHMKGSEEAVQKAVVLIQEAVGTENMDEKIELPPTKPKQASANTEQVSDVPQPSAASLKIPKKRKKKKESAIKTWTYASCQWLQEISINTCKSSTRHIKNLFDISSVLCFIVYWSFVRFFDDEEQSEELPILFYVLSWLVMFVSAQLLWHALYYGMSLAKHKPKSIYNIVKFSFGVCIILFVSYKADLLLVIMNLLLWRLIANGISWLGLEGGEKISKSKNEERKRKNDRVKSSCLDSVEKQTIYTTPSSMTKLTGRQGKRNIKEVICKSGVDDIRIKTSDNSVSLIGSGKSVQNAIGLIQEVIGKGGIRMIDLSSSESAALAPTLSLSDRITDFLYRWSEGGEAERATTVAHSNQDTTMSQGSSNAPSIKEKVVDDVTHDKLAEEMTAIESSSIPAMAKKERQREEEVPSEIGIDSCQGMTRETITEASMSSLNDRSNTSKAYSNFTLNENDPLLIFLRSQASCIKGSVDEFYTWLVKSEDIDSMLALKEAVNEDDYLNDMKVGDGEGSGVKGFKRKAFLRAISEYFDESDTKSKSSTAAEHQSLPQCQKKNLNESLEPPEELVCPISLHLMTNDPVVAADGITYERASIENWFEKSKAKISEAQENLKHNPQSESDQRVVNNGVCSPVYGSKLENLTLVSITVVRNMARAYKEKKEAGS